jgi:hypothetical protein
MGRPDSKCLRISVGERSVDLPFDELTKFPLNQSPVFSVKVKLRATFPEFLRSMSGFVDLTKLTPGTDDQQTDTDNGE